MKIIIDNQEFDYEIGLKILKLKYKECPFEEIKDIWNDIPELTFKEIGELQNLEERRIAFLYFGIERLLSSVNSQLVDKQELDKETEWITADGKKETLKYKAVYELYKIDPSYFKTYRVTPADNFYFIKVKDTSTDREYIIWIDKNHIVRNISKYIDDISALDAVAWTIRTRVPEGKIEKIIRQGEVLMFKIKENTELLKTPRHLTAKEFLELLKSES